MSAHYDTEPPPTASATLHTTVGPIHISLFARQTPLACKNFLQHCLDGYYENTTFHRVVPNFIIQGGDPTGSGSGGSSIYEYPEFEYDPRDGEKVVFKDEFHSRLRFNRRGLVGLAKSEDGTYGSQFFITLANVERDLKNSCTMFGRVEGESIYKVASIAEAELVEGSDRPMYAVKITGCEVDQLGPFEGQLKRRERIAVADKASEEAPVKGKKKKKAKVGKALLSFAGDEEDGEAIVPTKPKFNTRLVREEEEAASVAKKQSQRERQDRDMHKPEPARALTELPARKKKEIPKAPPREPDPNTQLPIPDPESPSRPASPSGSESESPPPRQSLLSKTNAEIAALKASMKRSTAAAPVEPARKKSALESLIPETSVRGARKRTAAGSSSQDAIALDMFNAFKAKLESADSVSKSKPKRSHDASSKPEKKDTDKRPNDQDEEEEQVCDLHFVAGCLSCRSWDAPGLERAGAEDDDDDTGWMTHTLQFGKDTLGKDLSWKQKHQENDDLVVIDPRQKEKEITGAGGRKRERERKRKLETGHDREWDRRDAKKAGNSRS
ncbi:Peptidyl-prolyl isomerase cwc27 [Trichophyton interdigitale]|uniref:Peptidyl-prolyl cis-trans isomerase n=1 Tax=Trichophyton interdigitale TaxID=101480 RepID=A0A9P5CXI7_9EURO|nr:putative Peptidyl-prolyl cis-trans isomerase [Trichophyton interdigitale]KAF3898982.1 putative Peptidyl-prolyl cis-trans isomerase [Trichophyton interdigitale]KAG8210991.1 Peptidyl-prolyl isomerase cwc27 [Trichophyton interdigitale]